MKFVSVILFFWIKFAAVITFCTEASDQYVSPRESSYYDIYYVKQ